VSLKEIDNKWYTLYDDQNKEEVLNYTNLMLKMLIMVPQNYSLSLSPSLSKTLEEWLKLNVGIIDTEDQVDETIPL
jgi:hypothetical protein